jgi:hypothetical protein
MVRPAADATAVLRRHIAAAQLDARTRPILGQRWHTRTAAGGAGGAATCHRSSTHRGVGMVAVEWVKAAKRSK